MLFLLFFIMLISDSSSVFRMELINLGNKPIKYFAFQGPELQDYLKFYLEDYGLLFRNMRTN